MKLKGKKIFSVMMPIKGKPIGEKGWEWDDFHHPFRMYFICAIDKRDAQNKIDMFWRDKGLVGELVTEW